MLFYYSGDLASVHSQFLEDEVGDILAHFKQPCQQMFRLDGLLTLTLYQVDSLLNGLLRFDSKVVEVHILFLLSLFLI